MTETEFLRLLASPDDRAHLVELLRVSAELLEGEFPFGEPARTTAAFRSACRLRAVASALCGHSRIGGDGVCRYCDTRPGSSR